jgi:5,10-methylenetetrahydrofolate reductase
MVKAGAEFIQTQVVFDIDVAKQFLKEVDRFNVPILMGIFPMKSYGVAKFFDKNIPGVPVPAELLEKLKKAKSLNKKVRKQKYDKINLELFIPFIKELRKTSAAGCHIMAVGYERLVPKLFEAVKI